MTTATAGQVATIYAAVLELDRVDVEDDLYSLGCDSLQAVRIALELERQFRVGLPVEVLERSGRVVDVAAWIDSLRDAPSGTTSVVPRHE